MGSVFARFVMFLFVETIFASFLSEHRKLLRINGDIILGGIFPMHEHISGEPDFPCGAVKVISDMFILSLAVEFE